MADEIEDALREMTEFSNPPFHCAGCEHDASTVKRWAGAMESLFVIRELCQLEVKRLREVVQRYEESGEWPGASSPHEPDVEFFPVKSNLPQSLLFDFNVGIELHADHEGAGKIRIDYSKIPHGGRLQALLSVMGALGERIAFAIGNESYIDMLRGIADRRERER